MVVAAGDGFSIASAAAVRTAACRSAWFVSHACAEPAQFAATRYNNLGGGVSGLRRLLETFAGTA